MKKPKTGLKRDIFAIQTGAKACDIRADFWELEGNKQSAAIYREAAERLREIAEQVEREAKKG